MNKRERCKIYKEILWSLENENFAFSEKEWKYSGFCFYIQNNYDIYDIENLLELYQQKPKRSKNEDFWWQEGVKRYRILAIKKAIELCKPNKKK